MRVLIYITCCLLVFSCSNVNNKEAMADKAFEIVEESATTIPSETFQYETIATLKLQELLDLNTLVKKHPNDSAIITQKAVISEDFNYSNVGKLVSIKPLEPLERINDSINKLKIEFISKNGDSNIFTGVLTATITSQRFIIDSKEMVSLKVTFEE